MGFLELLAKGRNSLQLLETVKPTRSGPANWRVGRNCEDLQMRSGVVRDEIGGRQNLDEITHVKSHLNQKYDIMLTWPINQK